MKKLSATNPIERGIVLSHKIIINGELKRKQEDYDWRTWVLEDEPIRALARAPRGLDEEDEPGTAQAAPPLTRSRIAIVREFR